MTEMEKKKRDQKFGFLIMRFMNDFFSLCFCFLILSIKNCFSPRIFGSLFGFFFSIVIQLLQNYPDGKGAKRSALLQNFAKW